MSNLKTVTYKKFNRHQEMNPHKLGEIGNLKNNLLLVDKKDRKKIRNIENYLCGLYDGYFYESQLLDAVKMLREYGYKGLSIRLNYIILDVQKYTFNK